MRSDKLLTVVSENLFSDENNWRNDYPDEDDSERENHFSCSDSEEEDLSHSNAPYRHRELCYGQQEKVAFIFMVQLKFTVQLLSTWS